VLFYGDALLVNDFTFLTSTLGAGLVVSGIALTVDGFLMNFFFTTTGSLEFLGFLFFMFDVNVG
jgi:hypothetical protein